MILDHVPGRADAVVIPGPAADADVLGHRDLDMIHVAAIPDRLEQRVSEPERQQVLYRLLAQVVIDPEDRMRREDRAEHVIELTSADQVMPERLLDHDPPPAARRRLAGHGRLHGYWRLPMRWRLAVCWPLRGHGRPAVQAGPAELFDHHGKLIRRDRPGERAV